MLVSNWLITKLKIVLTTVYICKQFLCCLLLSCIGLSFLATHSLPCRFPAPLLRTRICTHRSIPRHSCGECVCSSIFPCVYTFNHFIFIFVSFYTIHVSCSVSVCAAPPPPIRFVPHHRPVAVAVSSSFTFSTNRVAPPHLAVSAVAARSLATVTILNHPFRFNPVLYVTLANK